MGAEVLAASLGFSPAGLMLACWASVSQLYLILHYQPSLQRHVLYLFAGILSGDIMGCVLLTR